jgi:hypothetical protein
VPQVLRWLFEALGRRPFAFAFAFALAGVVLLAGLGTPGLWEPHERQLSDRVAPPLDPLPTSTQAARTQPPADDDCPRTAPQDALARTLTPRAIEWGRDTIADSDTGRRLPLALLGLVTVLAAVGTAMRAGGARAGVVAGIVLLAMPLLVLQARMLTSEIGTACGGALIIYALVAFALPARRSPLVLAADLITAAIALAAGIALGFAAGGALHGWLVPIGAFAAAGALGAGVVRGVVRGQPVLPHIPALIAGLVAIGLAVLLFVELYDLVTPYPGLTPPPARQVFGKAIVAGELGPDGTVRFGCWSPLLGAVWRPDDDLRYVFDSTFEQIAYGTYPWGILAPIAMFGLLRSHDASRRLIGAVTLAWAAAAWIAAEAFHRKSGFVIWPAFPALAIAIGVWLDDLIVRRTRTGGDSTRAAGMLIGLFVAFAVIDFGKDMQSFTEKLTSLLVGGEPVPYPKDARLLVPVKLWVFVLGAIAALGFAIGITSWRAGADSVARTCRRVSAIALAGSLSATVALAAFWSFGWQPSLAEHLSSKSMLDTYERLRDPDRPEPLYVMGDLGQAPAFYTDVVPQPLPSREQIVARLKQPERVFAIAPQTELCALHREMGESRYYVVDARNLRSLLVSNRVDGTTDQNPLADAIVHKEPAQIPKRPKQRVVWDNRIELIGWGVPERVRAGDSFEVVTYYKILSPVGGAWTMLVHIDGPVRLRDGDHKPIKDRCPTSTWMPGDYIIDRHTMHAGGPSGKYEVWIGFFTGSAPNFKNMNASAAPGDMVDGNHRVKIGTIIID